jgi:hypothetical protein
MLRRLSIGSSTFAVRVQILETQKAAGIKLKHEGYRFFIGLVPFLCAGSNPGLLKSGYEASTWPNVDEKAWVTNQSW